MGTSILTSVKKIVGLEEDYTAFDPDIIMHINGTFSTLNQLGIGPEHGFEIEDAVPVWDAFLGTDPRWNFVKTYVSLKVRLLFDPPSNSFTIDAIKKQLEEYEWRINLYREHLAWYDPSTSLSGDVDELNVVLDGGTP